MSLFSVDLAATSSVHAAEEDTIQSQQQTARLTSTQIGFIGETVVASQLLLASEGRFSPFLPVADGWLQPRSLDARSIQEASADVVFQDFDQYWNDVHAIERPLVAAAVEDSANRQVALDLTDGDRRTSATGPAAIPARAASTSRSASRCSA